MDREKIGKLKGACVTGCIEYRELLMIVQFLFIVSTYKLMLDMIMTANVWK